MAHTLAVVGVVLILLGLVHLAALPLVLQANKSGGLNRPSIEDVGMGFHLAREPVLWGPVERRRGQVPFGGDPASLTA